MFVVVFVRERVVLKTIAGHLDGARRYMSDVDERVSESSLCECGRGARAYGAVVLYERPGRLVVAVVFVELVVFVRPLSRARACVV